MDRVAPEVRSQIMRAVRSKGNATTELALGKLLWGAGLRGYRKQWKVDGRPDFAWPGLRVAVFVDGCFWHGCRCKRIPKANRKFWAQKILTNQMRDQRVARKLRNKGWAVLRIKECAVGKRSTLERIRRALEERRAQIAETVRLGRAASLTDTEGGEDPV